VCQGTDPDYGVPVFAGRADRRALVTLFGLPNLVPDTEGWKFHGEMFVLALLHSRRELFVDDYDNGRLMAVWLRKEPSCRSRT
jgi:hypothetical protein